MAEQLTKWKIQFFEKNFVDNIGGYNQGTFYTYSRNKNEALDNLRWRWKQGNDPKLRNLPQLLGMLKKDDLVVHIVPDDGLGPDKHILDFLNKRNDQERAKSEEEYRRQRGKSEEEDRQEAVAKGLCPNCLVDTTETGFCQECGFNADNPVRPPKQANWFETRMRKEAELLPKKK